MKVCIVTLLLAGCALGRSVVYAGSVSSLSCRDSFDNNSNPAARAADSGPVVVRYSGGWFDSGACELYVDGVLVGSSAGTEESYALAAGDGTWRSYDLTLRFGDKKIKKFVTVHPFAGFACSLHGLTQRRNLLDARPAGTVRRIHPDDDVRVSWSGLWNDAADRSVVALYKGRGTGGESLGELVSIVERTEGDRQLSVSALPFGLYTLTHFDGVETLVAYLNLTGRGSILVFR